MSKETDRQYTLRAWQRFGLHFMGFGGAATMALYILFLAGVRYSTHLILPLFVLACFIVLVDELIERIWLGEIWEESVIDIVSKISGIAMSFSLARLWFR